MKHTAFLASIALVVLIAAGSLTLIGRQMLAVHGIAATSIKTIPPAR